MKIPWTLLVLQAFENCARWVRYNKLNSTWDDEKDEQINLYIWLLNSFSSKLPELQMLAEVKVLRHVYQFDKILRNGLELFKECLLYCAQTKVQLFPSNITPRTDLNGQSLLLLSVYISHSWGFWFAYARRSGITAIRIGS